MNNLTEFECDACGIKEQHDSAKRHIPFHWCSRNIEGEVYVLCGSCGIEGPFAADIAPKLCKKFADKGIFFEDCEQWGIKKGNDNNS